ncbi:META domain-containing protein [Marinobacterium mangrovicola]|uniref:Heat shock protein HslJ n=1 Tax=Marinobacterium mangrovicola TaxID=1476959 RepID=A0A4R1GV95_9GAMM|nr:META domain-containing protein [Marinobacterium mangrovicola]TCK08252.1 uncharacterized protein CLV83_0326 [Marinobacterium mangrovicola]
MKPGFMVAAVLLATGCSVTPEQGSGTLPALEDKLTGKTWALVEIQFMDDSVYRPREGHSYTLEFTADGQVLVQADCNRGFGTWEHTPPSGITLGPAAVTRRYCGDDSLDGRFLKDLTYIRSYVIRDGDLYLATLADGAILKFKSAVSPSFDCSKAEGSVQTLICTDAELAGLDLRLDELYRKALESFPAEEIPTLKATQRGWIKGRDECWKAENASDCTREEYQRRITELEVRTGSTEVPAPVLYSCHTGTLLTAYFYNETLTPALVLGDGQSQHLLLQAVVASGARYFGQGVEFWTKGEEASYTLVGEEPVQCSKR